MCIDIFFNVRRGTSISASVLSFGLDSFPVLRRKCSYMFRQRLYDFDNVYIRTIMNSVFFNNECTLMNTWIKDLFCF